MSAFDMRQTRVRAHSSRGRTYASVLGLSALVATGAVAVMFDGMNSDTVIATGFDRAFASSGRITAPVVAKAYDGISGSEDFWLRTSGNEQAVKAVAIGSEITLSDQGAERRLTITEVREVGDAQTHISTAAHVAPVLLLTCREGDAKTGRSVQLRLESGRIKEVAVDLMPRAL
jgi:hypothetical protein